MDKKPPPEYRKVGGDDHHRLEELTARIDALEARLARMDSPSAVAQPAISDQRIKDLLTNAFEGGSNYWYRIKRCEPRDNKTTADYEFWQLDIPLDGGAVFIEVPGEGDNKEYRLDRAAIERAIALMPAQYPHHWADFLTENEDATTGDVFLQLALFGEVIYG